MKKTLLTFAFALGCIYSNGQNFIPATGNVGFGTGNPQFNLEINAEMPFLKIRSSVYTPNPTILTIKGGIIFNMENADKTAGILEAIPPGYHVPGILFGTKMSYAEPGAGSTDWYHRMFIHPNGNVGIGTTAPITTLHVENASTNYASTLTLKNTANHIAARAGLTLENDKGNQTYFYKQASGNSDANDVILYSALGDTRIYTSGTERFRITNSGNIGIGTIDPKGYKLAVAGNMIAESVKVKLQGTWPDYVFREDYKLPTLEETERHIREDGHLPGIPSANEVKANGIDLGEMNAKLLRKIEELTLYLVDQNQRLKEQEQKIKDLTKKL